VQIGSQAAAVVGSTATNSPPHVPTPPGTSFVRSPANRGIVSSGSETVFAGGRKLARLGDRVKTCNDPADSETSVIQSGSTNVFVGG
jgi:uncharacterized Zn-binding protein involved in type VI secretion